MGLGFNCLHIAIVRIGRITMCPVTVTVPVAASLIKIMVST